MVNFTIRLKNNSIQGYDSIVKVRFYSVMGDEVVVEGESLFTYDYPLGLDLQLFSDSVAYKVSGGDIKEIMVEKVDS